MNAYNSQKVMTQDFKKKKTCDSIQAAEDIGNTNRDDQSTQISCPVI